MTRCANGARGEREPSIVRIVRHPNRKPNVANTPASSAWKPPFLTGSNIDTWSQKEATPSYIMVYLLIQVSDQVAGTAKYNGAWRTIKIGVAPRLLLLLCLDRGLAPLFSWMTAWRKGHTKLQSYTLTNLTEDRDKCRYGYLLCRW